jgi:hypothetical protein
MAVTSSNPPHAHQSDIAAVLQRLLVSEQRGAFHFLSAADPYVSRATPHFKRALQRMIADTLRREGELAALLEDIAADVPISAVNPEHQYMAFLSFDYLLPKLREDKERSARQYESAATALGGSGLAAEIVARHLQEHRAELEALAGTASASPKPGDRISH